MIPTNGERLAVLETQVKSIDARVEKLDGKVEGIDAKLDQVLLRLAERPEPTKSDGITVSAKSLALLVPALTALGTGLYKLAAMLLGA